MKFLLLGTLILFISCHPSPSLQEGVWTGTLTPMNHPDMANPISYDVSYNDQKLSILIIGPNGSEIMAQSPQVKRDTLYFSFKEPEEQQTLKCKLGKAGNNKFEGKCTDQAGKWARFTMVHPKK